MRKRWAALAAAGMMQPAGPARWQAAVEIPRIEVAEYHRPYVALWLEKPDGSFVANLAVWYDTRPKRGQGEEGTAWLKDLRAWWRKVGRELTLPVDGVTGPTRAPGRHVAPVSPGALPPGEYVLVAEAARELGGREVLRGPLRWDGRRIEGGRLQGRAELGVVEIAVSGER
ncbi:MAG: DUF2271 domain-containing protein [Bryobacteraceae bacterium]|nr:DUF2271 domain-containing protein [Bryobacteraceae bacterium]MCX7605369.1 DUF2271 domain-containing protein [Bryobacteraceae bacterium]